MRRIILPLVFLFFHVLTVSSQWVRTNGPWGGDVYALYTRNDILFAGTNGGVYRSADGGMRWSPVPHDSLFSTLSIHSFVADDRYLYAGAGFSMGVYRSSDNGKSWTSVRQGMSFPDNPVTTVIDLEVSGNVVLAATNDGVFISTDHGDHWTKGLVWNTEALASQGSTVIAAGADVYRSTDHGITWTRNRMLGSDYRQRCRALMTDRGRFIAAISADTGAGTYRSTDDGLTWEYFGTGIPSSGTLTAIERVGDTMYAATPGRFFRSVDDGSTWEPIESLGPIVEGGLYSFGTYQGTILAATGEGVFRPDVPGFPWLKTVVGLSSAEVRGVGTIGNDLMVGYHAWPVGTVRSSDGGETWQPVEGQLQFPHGFCFFEDDDVVLAGTNAHGIYYANPDTLYWRPGTMNAQRNGAIFTITQIGSRLFAISPRDFLTSTDKGRSWIGKHIDSSYMADCYALALHGTNLYAAVGNRIYRSGDLGANWEQISSPVAGMEPAYWISALYSHGSTLIANAVEYGVFRSTDDGESWSRIESWVRDDFNGWLRSFTSHDSLLFAAVQTGWKWETASTVYVSRDDGETWQLFNRGMEGAAVGVLHLHDDTLYAGTYELGLWKRPIADAVAAVGNTVVFNDAKLSLGSYPDPFAAHTTVRYVLPLRSDVRLEVFDLIGRRLLSIDEGMQAPGSHSTTIDLEGYDSGIYFCRLQAGAMVRSVVLHLER